MGHEELRELALTELYNAIDDSVGVLDDAIARISYHHPSCRGGDFDKCRCKNAVAARRLGDLKTRLVSASAKAEELATRS